MFIFMFGLRKTYIITLKYFMIASKKITISL